MKRIFFISLLVIVAMGTVNAQIRLEKSSTSHAKNDKKMASTVDVTYRDGRTIRYEGFRNCTEFENALNSGDVKPPKGYVKSDVLHCVNRGVGVEVTYGKLDLDKKATQDKGYKMKTVEIIKEPKITEAVDVTWVDGKGGTKVTTENYATCQEFYDANPNNPSNEWNWSSCTVSSNGVEVKWVRNIKTIKSKKKTKTYN